MPPGSLRASERRQRGEEGGGRRGKIVVCLPPFDGPGRFPSSPASTFKPSFSASGVTTITLPDVKSEADAPSFTPASPSCRGSLFSAPSNKSSTPFSRSPPPPRLSRKLSTLDLFLTSACRCNGFAGGLGRPHLRDEPEKKTYDGIWSTTQLRKYEAAETSIIARTS